MDTPDVNALALEYLGLLEAGSAPDLEQFSRSLPAGPLREELRELVAAARWARGRFPQPFRADAVLDGRYRLLRQLGSGGFGSVWLAEDLRLRRDVALKLVTSLTDAEAGARALRTEVQALGRLTHRGIVRLYDSGSHDGTLYLAMEHVAGRSLADVLEALAPLSVEPDCSDVRRVLDCPPAPGETSQWLEPWPRFCAGLAVEILWALSAAHESGIVHRDLKPANVMLTGSGRPVLLDFGIAGLRDHDAGTVTKGLFGTASYLAPEQLREGRSGKTPQVDVYQVGLVLYELLTRRRAFPGTSAETVMQRVREGDFPPPTRFVAGLDRALEDVVLRALAREPAQRYPDAGAFRTDLERWLAGGRPAASAGGVVMRAWRGARAFSRRHRRALVLGGALLAGGLPGLLWRARPLLTVLTRPASGPVSIELLAEGSVVPLGVWTDPDGRVVAHQAADIVDGDGVAQPAVRLSAGRHDVRLVARDTPDQGPPNSHLEVRLWSSTDAATADALVRFERHVAERVRLQASPLATAEFEELCRRWNATNRGGAAPGLDPLQAIAEAK